MTLRRSALAAAFVAAALLHPAPAPAQTPAERAAALLGEVPLIDGHNDYPWALREADPARDLATFDIRVPQPALMTDIPRLRAGRVGGQFWSVYVPADLPGQEAVGAVLEQIDVVHRMMAAYPDAFGLALTADDVERVFGEGRIASLIGVEGGHAIADSLATLRMLHRLGARYMTLTHSANLAWADSATGEPAHGGLTPFGEEVVREMNRLGMLVDLSHTSPDTMADALRVSEAPVIFSHSSARALRDHPRNVPDDILRQLPANGGVVMVTFVSGFLSDERATLADVADHMDHIRQVAGAAHVGIGSDYDGTDVLPIGLEDVSTYPRLVEELLRRGWSDDEVRQALGLNLLRVMRAAETVAARLQDARGPSAATIDALDGAAR